MRKTVLAMVAPMLVIVALAGCGSSSSTSSNGSTTGAGLKTPTIDPSIAKLVPSAIKSKGTLNVATEAQYAPIEFVAGDGHTIIGLDPDLVNALGAVMGLKVNLINSDFETIIPGLAAGRYDLGASAFTDTKERQKTVDFVDYFTAGISFYAKASANPGVETVADLCGKTVSAEKGTVEAEEATKQDQKCKKAGKPAVNVLAFPGQNAVNLAISSGRAEIGMADSPIADYQVKQSNGAFKLIGKEYEAAPYGLAIPKKSGMAEPIQAALKSLIADGTYAKILAKWGLQSGSLTTATINGATS
jgi:polar amino acid transport system substrate-binding protein